jgi:hypothetical protein
LDQQPRACHWPLGRLRDAGKRTHRNNSRRSTRNGDGVALQVAGVCGGARSWLIFWQETDEGYAALKRWLRSKRAADLRWAWWAKSHIASCHAHGRKEAWRGQTCFFFVLHSSVSATPQVVDDDGTDRTPKPLMSLNPSVLRGAGGLDNSDAASEAASEFFLVRGGPVTGACGWDVEWVGRAIGEWDGWEP